MDDGRDPYCQAEREEGREEKEIYWADDRQRVISDCLFWSKAADFGCFSSFPEQQDRR